MDIAIIGAGNVGSALAGAFTRAGHNVTVTARDLEHARAVAATTGATLADSNAAAAAAGEVVVLATPFSAAPEIAADITAVARGKVVVDVSNRMSFGPAGPEIDTTTSNAEELARLLPDARVVKAFNTLNVAQMTDPETAGGPITIMLAGDNAEAKATVATLVTGMGLEVLDVGGLEYAHVLEEMLVLWANSLQRQRFNYYLRPQPQN